MAKNKRKGQKGSANKNKAASARVKTAHDVFEEEEVTDRREVAGKYEVDTVAEAELPSDFEDEEISEDEAFDSEDEQTYGPVLEAIAKNKGKRPLSKNELDRDETSGVEDEAEMEEEDAESDEGPLEDGEMMLSSMLGDEPQMKLSTVADDSGPLRDDDEDLHSTDEESEADDDRHDNLLKVVGVEPKSARASRKRKSATEARTESEFGIAPVEELTLETMMGSLGEASAAVSTVKKQLSTSQKGTKEGPLPAPRAAILENRAERKVAYAKATENVARYQGVVKSNREAETLNLKAQQVPSRNNLSNAALSSKFEASTDLEKAVQGLLHSAGMEDEKKISKQELLEFKEKSSLDPEAAKAKYAEMAKLRSLIFYEEQKRKRISKIKSKLYHKIRKKHTKDLSKEEELELLRETNPEAAAALEEEAAESRAEERMNLRHQNTSGWVRSTLKKGADADTDSRAAVVEQLRQAQELKRKMERVGESDSDDSDPEVALEAVRAGLDDQQDDASKKGLMSMKFMQKAMERQREAAREEAENLLEELKQSKEEEDWSDSDGDKKGRATQVKLNKSQKRKVTKEDVKAVKALLPSGSMQTTYVQLDGKFSSTVDGPISVALPAQPVQMEAKQRVQMTLASPQPKVAHKLSTKHDGADSVVVNSAKTTEDNPWLSSSTHQTDKKELRGVHGKKNRRLASAALNESARTLDMDVKINKKHQKDTSATSKKGSKDSNVKDETEELVRQAFALDDEMENAIVAEKEGDADVAVNAKVDAKAALGVAGWGSWAGIGVMPSRRHKEKVQAFKATIADAKAKALEGRKDAKLRHVIINEKRDKKVMKYTSNQVPYPFISREQYERSLRSPIGRDWNTATATHKFTRPEVITHRGAIIEPLKLNKLQKEEAAERSQQRSKRRKL